MGTTITRQVTIGFEAMQMGCCGVWVAYENVWIKERRRDGESIYCPNGHCRAYKDTEEDRLRKQLAATKASLAADRDYIRELSDRKAAVEASLSATRGHLTRAKRRIAAGLCPYCKRNFVALSRHVRGQHPDEAEHFRESIDA